MLTLAGTQATAGLTETPVRLELLGQLGPQAPQALLELFERARSHRQAKPWVPAPTPKWLPRLKTYASRRSLSPQQVGIASGNFNPFRVVTAISSGFTPLQSSRQWRQLARVVAWEGVQMSKLKITSVLFGGLLAILTLAGPACADTMLDVPLVAGQITSVTYVGPDNADFIGTFSAEGAIGGPPFGSGELWDWLAFGPFNTSVCGSNIPGPCGGGRSSILFALSDGILLLTMSVHESCTFDGISVSSVCPDVPLSPYGSFEIDVPAASPGDLFLTPTPLPPTLPLFAAGLGAFGLLGWRRKQKAADV